MIHANRTTGWDHHQQMLVLDCTPVDQPAALRAIGCLIDHYGQRVATSYVESAFGVDSDQAAAVRDYDFFND